MSLNYQGAENRLVEFGVYCEYSVEISQPLNLLQIERLVISPRHRPMDRDFTSYNVHVIRRGNDAYAGRRLAWQWQGENETWPEWMPWSKTTGPFSYFSISVEGREAGRSYCIEFRYGSKTSKGSKGWMKALRFKLVAFSSAVKRSGAYRSWLQLVI